MSLIQIVWDLAYGIIQVYWAWAVGFMAIFALAAFIPTRRSAKYEDEYHNLLVLIPAYKEDQVILNTAKQAISQTYPTDRFTVAVIADSLKGETLVQLEELPIEVIEVQFEKSTKSKALRKALSVLPDDYDGVIILDADNIMGPHFLVKANAWIEQGAVAVQGRRVAKNSNSKMAVLDGISEEINNRVYCKGHNGLGFSSKLSGSGMVFSYEIFKRIMQGVDAIGGFDKELELKYTREKYKIFYDHTLKVFDEKVSSGEVFAKQRRRWLSSQYHYLRAYFGPALGALFTKGNLDFFNRAQQLAMPPRLLMPVFLGLAMVVSWIFSFDYTFWTLLFLINVGSFFISIPRSFWNRETLKSLLYLPKAILHAIGAMLRLRGANKTFIHTPHGVETEPEESKVPEKVS